MKIPSVVRTVVLFVSLTAAGVCLIALPQFSDTPVLRSVLPLIGVSLLTAGLGYFLIEMSRLAPGK